jgi:hypothetical protein
MRQVNATNTAARDDLICVTDQSQSGSFESFLHRIHLLSLWFCLENLLRTECAVFVLIGTIMQPQFEDDDVPQLGLIAVKPK